MLYAATSLATAKYTQPGHQTLHCSSMVVLLLYKRQSRAALTDRTMTMQVICLTNNLCTAYSDWSQT